MFDQTNETRTFLFKDILENIIHKKSNFVKDEIYK